MGRYKIKLLACGSVKEAERQAQELLDQHELTGFEPVLLASGERSGGVYVAILFQKSVGEKRGKEVIGKDEGFKLSKRLSAEVAILSKMSEDRLYEMVGEALLAQELLKRPREFLGSEGIKTLMSKTRKADSREKGRVFVNKLRGRMFKKICVEAQACKWEKHILKDTKGLVETLVPLVGSVVGFTIPSITFSVALIITKKGIREFCKCPPA